MISRHEQIENDNRLYQNRKNTSIYSTPFQTATPKTSRSINSNMRGSINRLSSATKRFGVSKKSTLGGSPKKSLAEKKEDLVYLMTDEPKKRSSTGYAISDDLRLKWKQLGPLSVEDIERHLHEWAEEQDADSAQIDYSGLDIG